MFNVNQQAFSHQIIWAGYESSKFENIFNQLVFFGEHDGTQIRTERSLIER